MPSPTRSARRRSRASIAEEVREPYYEEARKSCEAEVRADCAKKGVTDEAEIARRIESKAALLVLDKDDEIQPKIRKALEQYGKFAAFATALADRFDAERSASPAAPVDDSVPEDISLMQV